MSENDSEYKEEKQRTRKNLGERKREGGREEGSYELGGGVFLEGFEVGKT